MEPTRVTMTKLIKPFQTDTRGIAFGGEIMAFIDIAASSAARRHCGVQSVTASVDAVHFVAPVKLGDLVVVKAMVNRVWKSSIEIGCKVESENMLTGERKYCCHAYLTFVAKGTTLPQAIPKTQQEIRRFNEADERRKNRIAKKSTEPDKILSLEYKEDGLPHTCANTFSQMVEIVFPEHCNSQQITFGCIFLQQWPYHEMDGSMCDCGSKQTLPIVSFDSFH
ncbi:HotDog domain-containing protein [Gorgonomyces haynaldii]|nr:HotDog domain-containing protein [Gorgonomyces haynaldii]